MAIDQQPVSLTESEKKIALGYTNGWCNRHVAPDSGCTLTWTPGNGGAAMVDAMPGAQPRPFRGRWCFECGVRGVSPSLPVLLGPSGARSTDPLPLDDHELADPQAAAAQVATLASEIEVPA